MSDKDQLDATVRLLDQFAAAVLVMRGLQRWRRAALGIDHEARMVAAEEIVDDMLDMLLPDSPLRVRFGNGGGQ